MKSIKDVLNKLNELYQEEQPQSSIEIDLMLDYTRQLYDALLTERKGFSKENDIQEETSEAFVIAEKEIIQPVKENVSSDEIEDSQGSLLISEEEAEDESDYVPNQITLRIESEPEEKSTATSRSNTFGNISFEPPQLPEEDSFFPEEGIEEEEPQEEPVAKEQKIEESKTPTATPVDYSSIFNYAAAPKTGVKKDIRKFIGINDKYLFRSELFKGQEDAYEQALDRLNNMKDYAGALDWMTSEVQPKYDWQTEDLSVQSFYDLVSKYFAER